MAFVFATRSYDMSSYDLSWFEDHSVPSFHQNDPVTIRGTTYQHWFAGVLDNGSGSLIGTLNDDQTMRGLFHSTNSGTSGIWAGMTGVSFDVDSFDQAMETDSKVDDYALIRAELAGADTFDLSDYADIAMGYAGDDTMNGNGASDRLLGGLGNDTVNGGAGNDKLVGEAGNDTLVAGTGQDVLTGGAGKDYLIGGTDSLRDIFVFAKTTNSASGATCDVVRNFTSEVDLINLVAIDAKGGTLANDAFAWAGQTAAANAVWWKAVSGGIAVLADATGDKVADLGISLPGVTSITSENFLL